MPTPSGVAHKLWATALVLAALWGGVVLVSAVGHNDVGAWVLPVCFGPVALVWGVGQWGKWLAR